MTGLDTSRLTDKIGATVQESLGGRSIVSSVSPESHYRVNVAIPFKDHLLEEISSRLSEDNRAGAGTFSLVPSAVVKHDSRKTAILAPGLTPSSLHGNTFGNSTHPLYRLIVPNRLLYPSSGKFCRS